LIVFSSCSKDENTDLTAQASVIGNLETTNFILPDTAGGQNIYLFRLNWTKTKFFSESGSPMYVNNISYTIEADLAEGDFSNPVTIVITKGLYTDIYTKTLRTLFNNLAGADNKNEQTISIRVKAAGDNLTVYSKPV